MTDIYEEIVRIRNEGEAAALITVVSATGSTPREEGAKMLLRADGSSVGTVGGGRVEALAIEAAGEVMKRGIPHRLHYTLKEGEETGSICGGDVEIFIEPIKSDPPLYIFGGGHIGLALVKIAKLAGFKVTLIDDRPEFANVERFPEADAVLAGDYGKVFSKLKIDGFSYLVLITRGHKYDEVVLEKALGTEARYIGMIGSGNKNATVFARLLSRGITRQQLDRVSAPIGLEISADTPAEIAVSIMAEMIQVRRSSSS